MGLLVMVQPAILSLHIAGQAALVADTVDLQAIEVVALGQGAVYH